MTVRVNVLPGLGVVQLLDTDDGNFILLRRNQCSAFLADFMEAMADSIPDSASGDARTQSAGVGLPAGPFSKAEAENHSVRVPDRDGYALGSGKYEGLRLIESGER